MKRSYVKDNQRSSVAEVNPKQLSDQKEREEAFKEEKDNDT